MTQSRATFLAAGWLAISLGAIAPARAQAPEHQDVVVRGKVLPLATALQQARTDLRFDAGPLEKQVALVESGGEIIPLLSDEASRALFLDERMRNRPAEIKGRRIRGIPYLQVVSFKVEEAGRLRTPEYYCIVCSIRVRFPQTCPCCQGEMELRMKPEKD